jgi:hypothetical protein
MDVMTITEFLLARVAEDEASAKAASPGPWKVDSEDYAETIYAGDGYNSVVSGGRWGGEASCFDKTEDALHIARHDPARVLRQCEAIRRIVEEHQVEWPEPCHCGREHTPTMPGMCKACYSTTRRVGEDFSAPCETLCILASFWSDHPDFDPAWN